MFEILLLAIIALLIILKLKSILGEEHDSFYFGYNKNISKKKIKDAEKVNNFEDSLNDNFNYLTDDAKKYAIEISKRIENFDLNKFKKISSKVLEYTIKACNEQNKDEIKNFLSPELNKVFCDSFKSDEKTNIILVAINNVKICDILKGNNVYDVVVKFEMEQINYTTNKNNEIIDGNKNDIVKVNEMWYFTHDFNTKNNTWFVRKIEEL